LYHSLLCCINLFLEVHHLLTKSVCLSRVHFKPRLSQFLLSPQIPAGNSTNSYINLTITRRWWRKDDTQIREAFHIFSPPWSATLPWWWGLAPMTQKISKIWRQGATKR